MLRGPLTGVLLVSLEHLLELVANVAIGDLHVVLRLTVVGHEVEETIVGDVKLRR